MSDNLALDLVRASAIPDTPLVPHKVDHYWDWKVWSSNGIWMDQHTRNEFGDTIALSFRHPQTGEEAVLHFCRDAGPGKWYCPEANASVTDELMAQALAACAADRSRRR